MDLVTAIVFASTLNQHHVDRVMARWPSNHLVQTYRARDHQRNVDCIMQRWNRPHYWEYNRREAQVLRNFWQIYNWGQLAKPDPSDWQW